MDSEIVFLSEEDQKTLMVLDAMMAYAQREVRSLSASHPGLRDAIDRAHQLAQAALERHDVTDETSPSTQGTTRRLD